MANEQETNLTTEQQETQLDEDRIAKLANQELRKRDAEIRSLKQQLAEKELYSTAPEDDGEEEVTKKDILSVLGDNKTGAYDYILATVRLHELETSEGRPSPLGVRGEEVAEFFKGLIEECGDDKSAFISLYQARLGKDRPEDLRAYNKTQNK